VKEMKRKTERLIWILTLVLVVGIFYIAPIASSFKDEGKLGYYNKLLNTAFQYLNQYYVDADQTKIKDLYYGAVQGMYKATKDPYTTLLEPDVLKGLLESIQQEFEGIGAYVGVKDNRILIISPIEGTPAYKAGLRPGDIIMKIEDKDTEGMELEKAVSLLRGPADSEVRIEVYRKGLPQRLNMTIERQKIEIPSVKYSMMDNGIGYIKINSFGEHTPEEMEDALEALKEKGLKKLVIDLRFNPGGALNAVVEVANQFLEKGLIVYTVGRRNEETEKFYADDDLEVGKNVPMVILVNKGSASASEIFAGAMKDRKRGTIVGETSFGKGTVQNVFKILDGDDMLGLKITIAKYYTPGGYVIAENGIKPDVEISMPEMTPEEEFFSIRLMKDKWVDRFVEKYPKDIPDKALQNFKSRLEDKGIKIRDIFLKKIIRETQKMLNGPEIMDLEYDLQLQKAIEVLKDK
jgi:carboxyl-terminal processing protease